MASGLFRIRVAPYALAAARAYERADISCARTGTQVAIVSGIDSRAPIIAPRGTELDWSDIKTDLRCGFTPIFDTDRRGSPRAHAGVVAAWRSVRGEVLAAAEVCHQADGVIRLAGHSLGGAIAQVAAIDISRSIPGAGVELVTFGQPRAVHRSTVMPGGINYLRLVNNNDTVARLPPALIGYAHYGARAYFDELGAYRPGLSMWAELFDRIKGRIKDAGRLGTDGAKDHGMAEYLRIAKAADKCE